LILEKFLLLVQKSSNKLLDKYQMLCKEIRG